MISLLAGPLYGPQRTDSSRSSKRVGPAHPWAKTKVGAVASSVEGWEASGTTAAWSGKYRVQNASQGQPGRCPPQSVVPHASRSPHEVRKVASMSRLQAAIGSLAEEGTTANDWEPFLKVLKWAQPATCRGLTHCRLQRVHPACKEAAAWSGSGREEGCGSTTFTSRGSRGCGADTRLDAKITCVPSALREWWTWKDVSPILTLDHPYRASLTGCHVIDRVKTTSQMTRFRDGKVCNNLTTDEIYDHRIQSDYKCISKLQYPEGNNSTLGIASAW